MANIIENENISPNKRKNRAKNRPAHIDMTPMVDLACLLLTFFMLTTAFIKPKVMEIVLPSEGSTNQVDKDRVLNIILAENDQIFIYNGLADPSNGSLPVMVKSSFSENGIRKILLERNKSLFERIFYYNDSISREIGRYNNNYPKDSINSQLKKFKKSDSKGPIVLIKAAEGVSYGNLVDIVDEMAIASIARYAVVDINIVEKKMLKDALSGVNVENQN